MKLDSPQEVLDRYEVSLEPTADESEFKTLCPFHKDTNPSCGLNIDQQVFHCLACGAKGDLVYFLQGRLKVSRNAVLKMVGLRGDADADIIDPTLIEKWHGDLLTDAKMLDTLLRRKGLTVATCEEYGLGLFRGRVTIPVYDDLGEVVNVRMWSPTAKQKMVNMAGHGKRRLYPLSALDSEAIIVAEGEMKALLLRQEGFNAISPTGGAKTWAAEWNPLFVDKVVWVCFDIDKAGKEGAAKVARGVVTYAASVNIVHLPMSTKDFPTGGVDEYFLQMGHTADDFKQLLAASPPFRQLGQAEEEEVDEKVYEIRLHDTSKAKYHGKFVKSEVAVSAKDTAPFIIPKKVEVLCPRDRDICSACGCFDSDKAVVEVGERDPNILRLVNVTATEQRRVLKTLAGIPRSCEVCQFRVQESQNVEELRLIPQLQMTLAEDEHIVRRAFYVGYGVQTNTSYSIEARVCPEPRTQYATLLAYQADPAIDSLDTFDLAKPASLKIFQPKEWTLESLTRRLDSIYTDLEANVTRIFQRRALHVFYDLVYHSPLYLPFQGRLEKGWVEGLVLGDSGQGKSEAIKHMMRHYQVGEKLDSKGASVAGLLGGLQETSRRWFVTWGIIPLNDRRLVVLEEVKGMSPEVIAKLTEMRSSGIAEISKIEKMRTHARTRLIWISNARSDRPLLGYNFGIEAVRELIGNLEDIRRFDFAITVASGEVPKSVLNMPDRKRPKAKHRYTTDLCRDLVLWAWSRGESAIRIDEDAIEAILEGATELGKMFVATIPLVEPADQRLKLARLSASLAARTFSTTDYETLEVHRCHVEYIIAFLKEQYAKASFGYLEYSRLLQGETELREKDAITEAITRLPYARDVVKQLLDMHSFRIFDIMDLTELDQDTARTFISVLVRSNAAKRERGFYVKTPAFIALLRSLDLENKLHNDSLLTMEGASEV